MCAQTVVAYQGVTMTRSDPLPPPTHTPAGLRDRAARARRLASAMLDEQTVMNLTAFADALEAKADELEKAP